MNRYLLAVASIAALLLVSSARADAQEFHATLSGFDEIPAILSDGQGTLTLNLDRDAQTLTYTLTYSSGLTTPVTQSHIHFGKIHVAGGIFVFLCTNLGNGPVGTPACPNNPGGTVTGTITSAKVSALPVQNITAGDFDAVEDALTSHTAYVNVHTTKFPAGEIRGEIRAAQ